MPLRTKVKEQAFRLGLYGKLLENEKPFWKPGKETGYHMMTTGWLIGELIKKISGKSFEVL